MKKAVRTVALPITLSILLAPFAAATTVNWIDTGANVYTNGFVGIGTTTPNAALHLAPNHGVGINFRLYDFTYFGTVWSSFRTVLGGNVKASETNNARMDYANTHATYGGVAIEMAPDIGFIFHTAAGPSTADTPFNSPRMYLDVAGNLGIGTQAPSGKKLYVSGDAKVTGTLEGVGATFTGTVTGGNIQAKYQDVAEWVPASETLAPGMVVVLDPDSPNHVMASSASYDTSVAGVVSAQPGISLGEASASKAQVATTGRVKVRVDAGLSPIRIGDLLVTSDKPGVAMKSVPMDIGGRKFHQPGTIIGKALEPLASGEREILVLLSLQ